MATTNPAIRVIKAACCCAKKPDAATNWRASTVMTSVSTTTPARSPSGIRPTRAPRNVLLFQRDERPRTGPFAFEETVDIVSSLLTHLHYVAPVSGPSTVV